jgi:SMC interacting uncharacterized protein involved in chromosome segregation
MNLETLNKKINEQKTIIKKLVNKKVDFKNEYNLIADIKINKNQLYKLQIELLEKKLFKANSNLEFNKMTKKIEQLKSKLLK